MTVSTEQDLVTADQLTNYAKLILKVTGIRVSPQKRMLLSNRIRRRLKETGIKSYQAYYDQLRRLKADDPEWDAFLQEITTHETYLYRDEAHWQWFCEKYVPEIQKAAASGKRKKELRIWSAASSTGDEAYTIASCLADRLTGCAQWKIEIIGTDIGVGAVNAAEKAEFGLRAMRLVPESARRRFFKKQGAQDLWVPKSELRNWTSFHQHNLLEPPNMKPFDMIFLKNVLIYFDDNAKETTCQHLCKLLQPGGVLVTSAADNANRFLTELNKQTPWMYRKPETSKTLVGKGKR